MEIRLPYGRTAVAAEIPAEFGVDVVDLPATAPAADPVGEVRRALTEPIGGFTWSDWRGVASVAVAVNDKTRPVPHRHLLPALLERLDGLDVPASAVTFHIAVGTHPPMQPHEFGAVLPAEIISRYRVVSHDAEDDDRLVELGETSRGTPVLANREYARAAMKVVVGTIEPHQFVGFSGGVKSAAIGLAGLATINANHSLMAHPDSLIATYSTNPARQDVEEIGRSIGVDLALNAILDPNREIVRALAGDPIAVMEVGAPLAAQHGQVPVDRRYGLVVASPGGHPKDINVYQAQKAVSSAARIVRDGGTIVLTAACPEGSGSEHYEHWVSHHHTRDEVVDAFRSEGFRIGPHKAFQLARDSERARLIVCSDMPAELSRRLLLDAAPDLQSAVDTALADLPAGDRVAVLPHAALTIPTVEEGVHAELR